MRISDWSSDVCSSDLARVSADAARASACGASRQFAAPRLTAKGRIPKMTDVVIAGAARTPVGSFNGSLSSLAASKLGALAIKEALKRSEEHTSELQSLMRISYAVFCLKKKKQHDIISYNNRNRYRIQKHK